MNQVLPAVPSSSDVTVDSLDFLAFADAADFGHVPDDCEINSNHKPLIISLRRTLSEHNSTEMEDDVMDNSTTASASTYQPSFAAMSRLIVGNPYDVTSPESVKAWQEVEARFARVKAQGLDAMAADVWWGLIEPSDGVFDWTYSDKLLAAAKKAGLKWVVFFSLHRCGGNIGDGANDVPVPRHIWELLAKQTPSGQISDVQYVSEFGNASEEYVSCWAVDLVLPYMERVLRAFWEHYASEAEHIKEVNISLGPAGELRMPSYNSHDFNERTGRVAYPTRGALQCYSTLALACFRLWVIEKYGDLEGVRKAWGMDERILPDIDAIRPPSDADYFFKERHYETMQYGRDLISWNSGSLRLAGMKILLMAVRVLNGVEIGAKIAGVHWTMGSRDGNSITLGSRQAELCAGLIETNQNNDWYSDNEGRGYRPLLSMFKSVQGKCVNSRLVIHFTCLEMDDGRDGVEAQSLARTLVKWFGKEANNQGIAVKGENALAGTIHSKRAWELMRSALKLPHNKGWYEGLTILRVDDIVEGLANEEFEKTVRYSRHVSIRKTLPEGAASATTLDLDQPVAGAA